MSYCFCVWPVACDLWPVACNLWPDLWSVTCTLAPQRSTSNFYALIGQMKPVYFDSWSWKSFVSTCDALNCLSLRDGQNGQNEIQLPSRVFCYSWLVCLLGFWFRNTSLVKVGNPISDGIVFVFHLAWCVRRLKSLKRFWPYLIVFSASRMVSLSNYCIWCLFFLYLI